MEIGTQVTIKSIASTTEFAGNRGTIVPNEIGDGAIWVRLEGFSAPLPFAESELERIAAS